MGNISVLYERRTTQREGREDHIGEKAHWSMVGGGIRRPQVAQAEQIKERDARILRVPRINLEWGGISREGIILRCLRRQNNRAESKSRAPSSIRRMWWSLKPPQSSWGGGET